MTESVRRNSKWDLKEDPHLLPIETQKDDAWSGKVSKSIHDKVLQSEWNSSKGVGSHDPKWSDMAASNAAKSKVNSVWSSWESSPGNRGEQKDKNIDRDCNEISQTMKTLGHGYGTSISHGFDGQREQNHNHSPKSDWSRSHRSRSRSPLHGSRRGLEGWNDSIRSGSVVSALPCNDFAEGRCRRGSQCRFLHQDNLDYEGRKHSGCGPGENWGSRHERGRSSGHANYEDQRDYSQDKISHGYEKHCDGDWEKHEAPRKNRLTGQCNDFQRGRYYRGSSCRYSHHDSLDDGHGAREGAHGRRDTNASFRHDNKRESRRIKGTPCKYFALGNCRNGEHCRFSHESAARDSPEGRSWDNKWDHNLDSENRLWGGPKWGDKAADSAHGSPEGRSRSDRWGHNLDSEDRSWIGPKWGDTASNAAHGCQEGRSLDDRWSHNLDTENRSQGGPKWSNKGTDLDVTKSSEKKSDEDGWKICVAVSQSAEKSLNDRPNDNLDNESRTWEGPKWSDKPADRDVHMSPQCISDDNDACMGIRESVGHEKLLNAAKMPSAGAHRERYSPFIDNKETGHNHQGSKSCSPNKIMLSSSKQNMPQEVSGQNQHAPPVSMQSTISKNIDIFSLREDASAFPGEGASAFPGEGNNATTKSDNSQNEINGSADILLTMFPVSRQSFDKKDESIDPRSDSNFDINGQSQQITPLFSQRGLGFGLGFDLNVSAQPIVSLPSYPDLQTPSHHGEPIEKPDMVEPKMSQVASGTPMTQSTVTSEQVTQMTHISASLAHILGKVQQHPHLYVDLNSSNSNGSMLTHSNDADPVAHVVESFVQPNQSSWSQKQYDPISDSIESGKPDYSIPLPGFSANPTVQNKTADLQLHTPLKSIAPSSVINEPNGGNHFEGLSLEGTLNQESHELKRLEPVADERAVDIIVKEQDTARSEDIDADGQVDEEGKKGNDAKAMRMFKFALVEFVKEILKPTWKEGRLSKEAHKTIVKKVVDKVTGTIQGAHIPQTKEKMDHYLSYSKPKLTKLVQAYVEKYLKT